MLGYILRDSPRELYRVEIVENGFVFTWKESLNVFFLQQMRGVKVTNFFATLEKSIDGGVVSVKITLPFITYPNFAHKKLDWNEIKRCAKKIQLLLWLLNNLFEVEKVKNGADFFLSQEPQLIAVNTYYSEGEDGSQPNAGLDAGFSPDICQLLSKRYTNDEALPLQTDKVFHFYSGLTVSSKKEYQREQGRYLRYGRNFHSVCVYMRKAGIPHFIVPGNCACLGANPDNFKVDHEISSHNLDTPLQQMAMLAAVVVFWNDILKPLHKSQ